MFNLAINPALRLYNVPVAQLKYTEKTLLKNLTFHCLIRCNSVNLYMQGKKKFTPKLFYQVSLEDLVPEDNFYRKLQTALDLQFLYKKTEKYYGTARLVALENYTKKPFLKRCFKQFCSNV